MEKADVSQVSERALERSTWQVGNLGSANHFLEIQSVDAVLDERCAKAFGLRAGQICVMIHCGSRGLGHEICGDHVRRMDAVQRRYGIAVPDPQLVCTPVDSPQGHGYLALPRRSCCSGSRSAAATSSFTSRKLSGVTEIESIPTRTRMRAKSGASLGRRWGVGHTGRPCGLFGVLDASSNSWSRLWKSPDPFHG